MFIILLKKIKYFIPLIIYSVLIFIVSGIERIPYLDEGITYQDKVLHFFAYLIYGGCIILALINSKNYQDNKLNYQVVLIGILFAISDEVHQSYVPGRSAEFLDLVADASGIIISLFLKTPILWLKVKIG